MLNFGRKKNIIHGRLQEKFQDQTEPNTAMLLRVNRKKGQTLKQEENPLLKLKKACIGFQLQGKPESREVKYFSSLNMQESS